MTTKPAVELTVDAIRNLIGTRFHGHVTAGEMEAELPTAKEYIHLMRPGFFVLTDLTDLTSMDLECVAPLTHLMDLFKAGGVGTVVRVIPEPDKDIGFNLLAITHYREGVRVITCRTLDEAERALAP